MIYDSLKHNEEVTPNRLELDALRENFPQYFDKDGQFMLDRFTEMLRAHEMQITKEGYELKFLGKSYAKYRAGLETETVIVPDLAHNSKPENKDSENLYIVGDNLDALQHLVKSYTGQVKCIYIDPPYNTGSDGFVYQDDFGFTVEQLVKKIGMDEEEAQRILDMQGKSSHSAWLTFMYPRLVLARELLSDDGVIFISIDDNEESNLKLLCDDIFGEQNFEGNINWRRRHNQPNDKTKLIGLVAEHVLVYSRNSFLLKQIGVGKIGLTGVFSNPDNDTRGAWNSKPWKVGKNQGGSRYVITTPSGKAYEEEWMGDENTFQALLADHRIYFPKNGSGYPRKKIFQFERENEGQSAVNWFPHEKYGNNQEATSLLEELFPEVDGPIFTNSKPIKLLQTLLQLGNLHNNEYILDFFSGSATTAQAVMQLNAEDGGNRRYIMVQWPEKIEEKKPAYQAGYRTIDEIGRERIKRAATKIKEETGADIDYGFKLVRLQTPTEKTIEELIEFDPNALHNRVVFDDYVEKFAFADTPGHEVILSTWLNQDGFGLLAKAEQVQLAGYVMDLVSDSGYIIEKGISSEDVQQLVLRIERGELKLNRIVVYPYSVPFAVMHELKQNLSVLKSGQKVEIIERF